MNYWVRKQQAFPPIWYFPMHFQREMFGVLHIFFSDSSFYGSPISQCGRPSFRLSDSLHFIPQAKHSRSLCKHTQQTHHNGMHLYVQKRRTGFHNGCYCLGDTYESTRTHLHRVRERLIPWRQALIKNPGLWWGLWWCMASTSPGLTLLPAKVWLTLTASVVTKAYVC